MILKIVLTCALAGLMGTTAVASQPGEPPADQPANETLLTPDNLSPVDILYPSDFQSQGYTTLPQVLANLAPSFIHPEPALARGTDHARPSGLRGMAPDQMVVLVNGRRFHTASWLHREDTYGRGSVGVDLATIPLVSVKRVEIMRDGASARYGSGAVAGVINIVLRDADDGGSLTATFGQYRTHLDGVPDLSEFDGRSPSEFELFERGDLNTDDGEGDTLTLAAQSGFTLFDDGFLHINAEYRSQDPTNRSGYDPRRIYPDLPNGDWDAREQFADRRTHRYGNPEQEDVKLLVNWGLPVGERTDFYGYLGYSARNAESADAFVLARSDANVESIHPDGYLPLIDSDDEDRYLTFGFRGHRWGWDWDLAYSQGEHEMDFSLSSSLNASLGEISPTSFEVANFEGRHVVVSLDLSRAFDVGLAGPLLVDTGVELRDAEYENEFGDRASYLAMGDRTAAGVLRPPGSQGFYGVQPVDDFDDYLVNLGAYVQAYLPLSDSLETEVGVRYDDEEGYSAVSGKLAMRWQASEHLSLRGTVSRDFRSPSPAQTYFLATQSVVVGNGYDLQGTYPADHGVAQTLGASELDNETSLNLGAGARYRFNDEASVGVDVYRIDVDDRIVLSNWLGGSAVTDALAAQGFANIASARYFFNGVDTRTRGVDLFGEYRWQGRWGTVDFRVGFNYNEIEVTDARTAPDALAAVDPGAALLEARDLAQLEDGTPESKLHASVDWQPSDRLALNLRLVRYGEVTDYGDTPDEDLDLGTPLLLDLNVRYDLTDDAFAGFGVHNFLDDYPTARPREADDPVENRILPYSNYSPYGFNGRFVYLRMGVDF